MARRVPQRGRPLSLRDPALGEPAGLYGFADQIVLTGQGVTADDEPFVVVYAEFERE